MLETIGSNSIIPPAQRLFTLQYIPLQDFLPQTGRLQFLLGIYYDLSTLQVLERPRAILGANPPECRPIP
jgi:hypothetical protein